MNNPLRHRRQRSIVSCPPQSRAPPQMVSQQGREQGQGGERSPPATPNGLTNGRPSPSSRSSPAPTSSTPSSSKAKPARRIEVEPMMAEIQRSLGVQWPKYRDVVTDFLTGKMNRGEFDIELQGIITGPRIRLHNQFMLAMLANALRDPPPPHANALEWSRKRKEHVVRAPKGDTRAKRLKSEIMGMPPKERRRIKATLRDGHHKSVILPSAMLESRVAKLPRIPIVRDKVTNYPQSIAHAYQIPLASTSHSLPDDEALQDRLLGIALQHGILNGVGSGVREIVYLGMEMHLKTVLGQLLDKAKLSHQIRQSPEAKKVLEPLTCTDIATALTISPHTLIEGTIPQMRLRDMFLEAAETRDEEAKFVNVQATTKNALEENRLELAGILDGILAS